jgi:hypothetical protein
LTSQLIYTPNATSPAELARTLNSDQLSITTSDGSPRRSSLSF